MSSPPAAPSPTEDLGSSELRPAPAPESWPELTVSRPDGVARPAVMVPSACTICGAGCGLLATVDRETSAVLGVQGNPQHPGSQGRLCAAGLASADLLRHPGRILYPLRRKGERGEGRWERVSWEEALDEIANRMRETIQAERLHEIVVHLGQPEADATTLEAIRAWGLDALATDTTAGSPHAGLGTALWCGSDRQGVDLEHARVILLVGSPRDGSPLLPDPRKILAARRRGAKVIVVSPTVTPLCALADLHLMPMPGTESVVLLAIAHHLVRTRAINRSFMQRWWNWQEYMEARYPGMTMSFPRFELALQKLYAHYTPEFAEKECAIPAADLSQAAEWVAGAGTALAAWCGGACVEGNLGGWQTARATFLLPALLGAVGTEGGVSPGAWWRFLPASPRSVPPTDLWNTLLWPGEFPLAWGTSSPLLPHLLRDGRGQLSVYLADRFDPVGQGPDGFSWIEALTDTARVGLFAVLTPTWTPTAWYADLVLPVGFDLERHGLVSAETHDAHWLGLQQPVVRAARASQGSASEDSRKTNPGQVWEEAEFWIHLAWRLDPQGEWGIREAFESRQYPGERVGLEEHYNTLLERNVPDLSDTASQEGQGAMGWMRRNGAFTVDRLLGAQHERVVRPEQLEQSREGSASRVYGKPPQPGQAGNAAPICEANPDSRGRPAVGVRVDGEVRRGFATPSARLEFYSPTLAEWGWPEYALPTYVKSHVHRDLLQSDELVWVPLFEAPTAEGSRLSQDIAGLNPLWIHPVDAARLGVTTGTSVRVETEIGHFVARAWVTEGVRPGVVASQPGRGRWRPLGTERGDGWATAAVTLQSDGDRRSLGREEGTRPEVTPDPVTERVWWTDPGVPATLAMSVHPDPVSGGHCWNQAVRVRPAQPQDAPGDATADVARAHRIVQLWIQRTRRAEDAAPDHTRRPRWLIRPLKPVPEAYMLPRSEDR